MVRALTRHDEGSAQVIPILLRATFWQSAPFAKLQMIPTNARQVTSWPDRDDAFHNITTQINQVISKLQDRRAQIQANQYDGDQQRWVMRQSEKVLDRLSVSLFDPVKLKLLHILTGHTDIIRNVVMSRDGKILVSASKDRAIKLWDVASGQILRSLIGHTDSVANAVFSQDGAILVSASQDRTVRLWEFSSGKCATPVR